MGRLFICNLFVSFFLRRRVINFHLCHLLLNLPLQNSIRHNLSLHNRFMRVQNEGTGKSSWWMLNPDAKPGKSVRRRAASMETSKYEKRRGRVRKRVEAIRQQAALGLASNYLIFFSCFLSIKLL